MPSAVLEPLPPGEWDARKASHLLSRAGFGATPAVIDQFSHVTPAEAVHLLLNFPDAPASDNLPGFVQPGIEKRQDYNIAPDGRKRKDLSPEERKMFEDQKRRIRYRQMYELRGWWLERMRSGLYPLQEKLVLFWHGHFATAESKVEQPYALFLQNQTFRRFAAGNWKDFLIAVSQDPAMLLYLDNARSKKGAPNENYARELMELFTLGEGNYTEKDVQESARAFTGWAIDDKIWAFESRPKIHDTGDKTFLGITGKLDGTGVVDRILAQPVAAPFLARKLWTYFAGASPSDSVVNALASVLVENKFEIRPVLRAMFRSRAFYSSRLVRKQVKSPVQWLVGITTCLEAPLPDPVVSTQFLKLLGQDIFNPPNVKGWDGNLAWVTANTITFRYNYAGALIKGALPNTPFASFVDNGAIRRTIQDRDQEMNFSVAAVKAPAAGGDQMMMMAGAESSPAPMASPTPTGASVPPAAPPPPKIDEKLVRERLPKPVAVASLLSPDARKSKDTARDSLLSRLYQGPVRRREETAADAYFATLPPPKDWNDEQLRDVLYFLTTTPSFQVC